MADSAKWYVVHTYSGYENAVKTSIEKFVTGRSMEDMILRIEVPMETVTEVTDAGTTKEVERKVFPGYVLIKMVMTDDTWHLWECPRGHRRRQLATRHPLTEEEVLSLGMKSTRSSSIQRGRPCKNRGRPMAALPHRRGDRTERNRVSVMVSMFGRETPVELELDQVEVQN